MQLIKLVWEFRGIDSNEMAKHHSIHLKEFIEKGKTEYNSGFEIIETDFAIAFLIIPKEEMKVFRDKLRPHSAFLFDN